MHHSRCVIIFLSSMFTSILQPIYRSGFYSRFSRYIRPLATHTWSIYNIWNFLGNLVATLMINITFRRAERFHSNSYRSYVYPALRSSRREKFTSVRHPPARVKNHEAFERQALDIAIALERIPTRVKFIWHVITQFDRRTSDNANYPREHRTTW